MVLVPNEVIQKAHPPAGASNLIIKTKNCVPHEQIQEQVFRNVQKMQEYGCTFVEQCIPHGHLGVFASAGPSLKNQLDKLQQTLYNNKYLVCVKHAHDFLISEGIIPWAAMLLDPRDHVKDFIENPHPEVLYFVATMCHPTTLDRLLDAGAKVVGYNALVGADEEKFLPPGHILLSGGSTSATRGFSVLHCLGFRRFALFGYDSCYWEPQDETVLTKTGAQKYFRCSVSEREFWTDAELVAQCQDFEKLAKEAKDISFEIHGDGMIPHVWSCMNKENPPYFLEFLAKTRGTTPRAT